MELYTVSYFSNGERSATDGVYDVVSSLTNAYKRVWQYMEDYNEVMADFDKGDMVSRKIYTDKGMYLIERFILDDNIEEEEEEEEDEEEDFEDDDYDEVEEEDEEEDDIEEEDDVFSLPLCMFGIGIYDGEL